MAETHNKGTGAGGSTTNKNGIAFEKKTDNENCLLSSGFVKFLILFIMIHIMCNN